MKNEMLSENKILFENTLCIFQYQNDCFKRKKLKHDYCETIIPKGNFFCRDHAYTKTSKIRTVELTREMNKQLRLMDEQRKSVVKSVELLEELTEENKQLCNDHEKTHDEELIPMLDNEREELLPRGNHKKYYYSDFKKDYKHAECKLDVKRTRIYPHEVKKFLHDVRAVLYRIDRVNKYQYICKMSKFEPELLSTAFNRKFLFVTKSGEVETRNIDQIDELCEEHGIKMTYIGRKFEPYPIDVIPPENDEVLNTYTGMFAKTHTIDFLTKDRLDKIKPMINFIFKVVCNRNRAKYNWIMSWIHELLYNPQVKCEKYLLSLGTQGCGKTTFMLLLITIIGRKHAKSFNTTERFFTRFNSISKKLLLACFNNMPPMEEGSTLTESIDSYVTDIMQNLEEKRIDLVDELNFTKFMFASDSNIKSIRLKKNDRKAFILQFSEKYANNRVYFAKVRACFEAKENEELDTECLDTFVTYIKYFKYLVDVSNDNNIPDSCIVEKILALDNEKTAVESKNRQTEIENDIKLIMNDFLSVDSKDALIKQCANIIVKKYFKE